MDASMVSQHKTLKVPLFTSGSFKRKNMHKPVIRQYLSIHGVLTRTTPADSNMVEVITTDTTTVVYKDNWLDQIAINYLSQSLQRTTGLRTRKKGYDSLVEAARMVSKNFNIKQQQEFITQSLHNAFPIPIMSLIRTLLPNSKLARECYAVFTTLFFAWLVGPCERALIRAIAFYGLTSKQPENKRKVKESEINGKTEKNVAHVKKCRFLEQSNCVGMCVNLCKIPSQSFIKNSLGMPFNMIPNFDDMSCDMVFGQEPPAPANDPALTQPCFKICNHHLTATPVFLAYTLAPLGTIW